MFATTDIQTGAPQSHITLPQTAITFNPYGNTVFLVEEQGKGPDGKAAPDGTAEVRHHRGDPG